MLVQCASANVPLTVSRRTLIIFLTDSTDLKRRRAVKRAIFERFVVRAIVPCLVTNLVYFVISSYESIWIVVICKNVVSVCMAELMCDCLHKVTNVAAILQLVVIAQVNAISGATLRVSKVGLNRAVVPWKEWAFVISASNSNTRVLTDELTTFGESKVCKGVGNLDKVGRDVLSSDQDFRFGE